MAIEDEDNLIKATAEWMRISSLAIEKAGGNPAILLEKIPADLLVTLVRNSIFLVYGKPRGF